MSEKFKIAHFHEQGQDVILVLVSDQIHFKSDPEKAAILAALQQCATSAGLAGTAALVWLHANRLHSYGPSKWHSFLSSLSWSLVVQNINKELTCG